METADKKRAAKNTRARTAVKHVLEQAERPLEAKEIILNLQKEGQEVWPSTVYRTLELLIKTNAAVKTTLTGSDRAVYALRGHRHYAVCLCCHKTLPLDCCPMERFIPKLKDTEFQVLGHNVELYGYCRDCQHKS